MKNWFRPSKNEAQKSKVILAGVVMSFILASYQNCGKVAHNPVSSSPNAGQIAQEQKPAILNMGDANSVVLLGAYNNPNFGAYAYDVNVQTGEVHRTMYEVPANDPSNQPTKLCLSEEKRSALETAINDSNVCFFKKDSKADICTMDYIVPYAIIKSGSESFKLGENAKPCNDYVDVCTGDREAFIKTVQDTLAGLDSSFCN